MKTILSISFLLASIISLAQPYLKNQTYTYEETMEIYEDLALKNDHCHLFTYGLSDVGKPLHLFVITNDGDFNQPSIMMKNKRILLVNNAIHAGESCGVDASIELAKDLLNDPDKMKILEHTVICIIPAYNIGGMLNRNSSTRTGQNGPEEYGFRGNAKNLDLNRDFIKCDSKNAKEFQKIFHDWNPDVFIDTHTTNGVDYQYNMSIITTQPDKLNPNLEKYVRNNMNPAIYGNMKKDGYETVPYVSALDKTPDNGFKDYLETPRYSTGYTTLFNTIGYVTEAHKYKPYKDRVEATYQFIYKTLEWMNQDFEQLGEVRNKAIKQTQEQIQFPIFWELDTVNFVEQEFKGFNTGTIQSKVSGKDIHYYDQEKPYIKGVKYYDHFNATKTTIKPNAYIIPQAYTNVINELTRNQVVLDRIDKDTLMEVKVYYIDEYETVKNPYESHYLHYNVKIREENQFVQFYEGDYVVQPNQKQNRYIIETLEPEAHDSFFAWNFFDGILQQKEWFSPWHFDDEAAQILASNPNLQQELDDKKAIEQGFADDHFAQLYFIYKNSEHYEKTHNRYPVFRLEE